MSEPGAKPVALRFPRLAARDLEGRVHSLPDDFAGTRNLVVVAFRREQQSMVDSWIAWFAGIAAQQPGVRCYEVPVIATRWSPARLVIDGGMARAVQDARRRTLTVYTDVRRVTDALAIDDTRTVTVLMVNNDGRVRGRTTGPANEQAGVGLLAALTGDDVDEVATAGPAGGRLTCALATSSTSGASKRSSLGVCCGFAPRCVGPAMARVVDHTRTRRRASGRIPLVVANPDLKDWQCHVGLGTGLRRGRSVATSS